MTVELIGHWLNELEWPGDKQEKGEDLWVCEYSSPLNSSVFVLRDRGALFLHREGAHKGTEMHTSAGQCSPQRKIHLLMCAARAALGTGTTWMGQRKHSPGAGAGTAVGGRRGKAWLGVGNLLIVESPFPIL